MKIYLLVPHSVHSIHASDKLFQTCTASLLCEYDVIIDKEGFYCV